MQELRVDKSLQSYLPIPNPVAVDELERVIVEHGCRDPIIVRNGVIIDGHHRYAICKKHGIPFKTQELDEKVDTDEKIRIYMLDHCLYGQGTRQLSDLERREQVLRLYDLHIESGTKPAKAVTLVANKSGRSRKTVKRAVEVKKVVDKLDREVADTAGGREKLMGFGLTGLKRFVELSVPEQVDLVDRHGADVKAMEKELSRRRKPRTGPPEDLVGDADPKAVTPTVADIERVKNQPAAAHLREALEHLANAHKAMQKAKDVVPPARFTSWRQRMVDLDADWTAFIREQLEREGVDTEGWL